MNAPPPNVVTCAARRDRLRPTPPPLPLLTPRVYAYSSMQKMTMAAFKNALVLLRDPHTAAPKQPQIAKKDEAPVKREDERRDMRPALGGSKPSPVRKPSYKTPEKVTGGAAAGPPSTELDVGATPSVEEMLANGAAAMAKPLSLAAAAPHPRSTAALLLSRSKQPQPARGKVKSPGEKAVSVPQRAVKDSPPTEEESRSLLPESEQMAA